MVALARQVFDEGMPGPNQLQRLREDVVATAAALLEPPSGTRTEAGLRLNIRVGIQYLEAWLGGQGAVPIHNLMEDAATAEISRTQIWQWIQHRAALDDGRTVTRPMVQQLIAEESAGRNAQARALFEAVATSDQLADFLTLPAYEVLVKAS
jgi:malate synthase